LLPALSGSFLAAGASPIAKVIQLLSGLEAKIGKEGEAADKAFTEFSAWCKDRELNLGFEIKTGQSDVAELKATIDKETSKSTALGSKIEDLAASIATNEADLKSAIAIRDAEAKDFATEEKDLMEVIDMLDRATTVLQREMQKSGASFLELKQATSLAQAFSIMVKASVFSSADASRLTAFVQSAQGDADSDGDADVGSPDAAVYKGHSGDIIETLQGLSEKAQAQLSSARKSESTALFNFQTLKQSLQNEIKFASKEMGEAKADLAASSETKVSAEGTLATTAKELASDVATAADLKQDCAQKAEDYQAAKRSRAEELKALADAKQAISEKTGGADSIQYGLSQTSFLQFTARSKLFSGADLAKLEAVRLVRELAKNQHSTALAQLAQRMAVAMRFSAEAGEDPFAKVKGLITDMIAKLEAEAGADATHKAYCDKEMSETKAKQDDKTAMVEKLSTRIEQMTAASAKLKEQVAALQAGLADLAKAQGEMDEMRKKENDAFVNSKADMEEGIQGVQLALKILREYYAKQDKAHAEAEGAASSIVGLLEVVESDFSRTVAELTTTEQAAKNEYDQQTKDNEIERTAKEQDVKYKGKEATDLDKAVKEATSDRSGIQTELDAVTEYAAKLKEICVAKPETYAERDARRQAEIAGLKQALEILGGEASLLQKRSSRRAFLGAQGRARAATAM